MFCRGIVRTQDQGNTDPRGMGTMAKPIGEAGYILLYISFICYCLSAMLRENTKTAVDANLGIRFGGVAIGENMEDETLVSEAVLRHPFAFHLM